MNTMSQLAWGVAAFVAVVSTAPSAEGVFRDISFEQAIAAAKAEDKVVFVDFYTTWCGPCKKLDTTTWVDEAVVAWLGANTIPIKLDAEIETSLAKKYRVKAYPTMVFIDPDGSVRGRIVGYRDAESFLADARRRLSGQTALEYIEEQLVGHEDDVLLRQKRGTELARIGRHEEALSDFLFCFDEGADLPAFAGVRVSFLLSSISRLGKNHPPALTALRERAEASRGRLLRGEGGHKEALDLSALNRILGDNHKTLEVYDALAASEGVDPVTLSTMYDTVVDLLIKAKRYQDVLDGAGDVFKSLRSAIRMFEDMEDSFTDSDAQSHLINYMRGSTVAGSIKHYWALIGIEDFDTAEKLAEALITFDPSARTFGELALKAGKFEQFATARGFLERGYAIVDKDKQSPLRRANRRLPKAERFKTP